MGLINASSGWIRLLDSMGFLKLLGFKVLFSVQHIPENNTSFAPVGFVEGSGLGLVLLGKDFRTGHLFLR